MNYSISQFVIVDIVLIQDSEQAGREGRCQHRDYGGDKCRMSTEGYAKRASSAYQHHAFDAEIQHTERSVMSSPIAAKISGVAAIKVPSSSGTSR